MARRIHPGGGPGVPPNGGNDGDGPDDPNDPNDPNRPFYDVPWNDLPVPGDEDDFLDGAWDDDPYADPVDVWEDPDEFEPLDAAELEAYDPAAVDRPRGWVKRKLRDVFTKEGRRESRKWYFVDHMQQPPVSKMAPLRDFEWGRWGEVEANGMPARTARKLQNKAWNAALGLRRYAGTTRWWDSGNIRIFGRSIPVTGDILTTVGGYTPAAPVTEALGILVPAVSFGRNALRAGLGVGSHLRAIRNQLADFGLSLLKFTVAGAPLDALYDSMTYSLPDFRNNAEDRVQHAVDEGILLDDVLDYRRGILGRSVQGMLDKSVQLEEASIPTRRQKRKLLEMFGVGGGVGKAGAAAVLAQKAGDKSPAKRDLLDRLYPGTEASEIIEQRRQLTMRGVDEAEVEDKLQEQIRLDYIQPEQVVRLRGLDPATLDAWLDANMEFQVRLDELLNSGRVDSQRANLLRRMNRANALRVLDTIEGRGGNN